MATIYVQNNGKDSLLYAYTDNQGSLVALTDQNGNVVEKYAYDPWGARRNPTDWRLKDTRTGFITNRGYTGHEHLDMFNIINMNGRVYDPLTAMFFSPDPFIQSPGNWLNYNRYGYCMNNPTRYTDPSGYQWDVLDMPKEDGMWVNHATGGPSSGFVGDGTYSGNLMAGFWSASFRGYNNGFSEFKNSFDKGTENINFTGSFTLYFTAGFYFVGKSHYDESKNWVLPELNMIVHSVTIKVGNRTSDKSNGQNSQYNDNFNHTISDQTTFGSKYLSVTFNSDLMTKNNSSNRSTVTTNKLLEPISITTGTLTVGKDGSITIGSTVFVGLNVTTGDYIFGINVPTGLNTSGGITITANGALIKGVGTVAVGVGIICTAPEVVITLLYY